MPRNFSVHPEKQRGISDMGDVNLLWQQAAGLLESASCVHEGESSDQAILLDEHMGLRMVDASGWQLHALRHEYGATTAYRIQRSSVHGTVVVQAETDSDQCILAQKTASFAKVFLQTMSSVPPPHLVYAAPATVSAATAA